MAVREAEIGSNIKIMKVEKLDVDTRLFSQF